MSVISKLLLSGSKGSAPSGARHAYNMGYVNYFNGTYPYLNVLKSGSPGWQGSVGPVNANQIPTAIPAGNTITKPVIAALAPTMHFPVGNYEWKDATTCTLSVNSSPGISAISPGVGYCTFTVNEPPDPGWPDFHLDLTVQNTAGSPAALSAPSCNLVSDSAALAAGNVFKSDYVDQHSGAKAIRIHDAWNIDTHVVARLRYFSDWGPQDPDLLTYSGNLNFPDAPAPPLSEAIKFARAVGARPWINCPIGSGFKCFKYDATLNRITGCSEDGSQIVPLQLVDGEEVQFNGDDGGYNFPAKCAPLTRGTSYFVVNATTNYCQLALTSGGAPIDFTGTVGNTEVVYALLGSMDVDPLNDMYIPFLEAVKAADPTCQPIFELGNEQWNYTFPTFNFCAYVASQLGGSTYGDAGTGNGWSNLLFWKAVDTVWDNPQDVTVALGGQGAYFDGLAAAMFDYVDPGVRDAGKTVKQQCIEALADGAPGIPRVSYAVASYLGYGVQVIVDGFNTYGVDIPDAYWDAYFDTAIAGEVTAMNQSTAKSHAKVPGIPLSLYEFGQQLYGDYGPSHDLFLASVNLQTYLDGPVGTAMYERFWAQALEPQNLYAACHYKGTEGRGIRDSGASFWSLTDGLVENDRSLWFKTK